ncbi:MAG: aspartyl-tRNA amidotransferase [Candidatus Meridianibacter frigidus]|nr:MAG: aspartyl-tRNA amidotransferase [Candidatus Eremiobacteraeota bacterium]
MGELKDRIQADMVAAMKSRDQLRVDTLRSALSGFTYKRTEAGVDLSDADESGVVRKQVKQRGDSITEYRKADRADLAEREQAERDILMAYLPAAKSEDEVREIVRNAIAAIPEDGRNQGVVMKAVMAQLKGETDGNLVRQIVVQELG